ncbi:MAG: HEAT repeat domain-containing protein [Planctomycetota bacterium]
MDTPASRRVAQWRAILTGSASERADATRHVQASVQAGEPLGVMPACLLLDEDPAVRAAAFDIIESRGGDGSADGKHDAGYVRSVLIWLASAGEPSERARAAELASLLPAPRDDELDEPVEPDRSEPDAERPADPIWLLSAEPLAENATEQLANWLNTGSADQQFAAANSLARVAPRQAAAAVPALVAALGRSPMIEETRSDGGRLRYRQDTLPRTPRAQLPDVAAWALLMYGDAAIEPLAAAIPGWDKNPVARENGAVVLGLLGERQPGKHTQTIVAALTRCLKDDDAETRVAAATSLERLGADATEANRRLIEAAKDEADLRARWAAIDALGATARDEDHDLALTCLRDLLADADAGRHAAESLARLGEGPALIGDLERDEDWRVANALCGLQLWMDRTDPDGQYRRLAADSPRAALPADLAASLCRAIRRFDSNRDVLMFASRVICAWCRVGISANDPAGWFESARRNPAPMRPLVDCLAEAVARPDWTCLEAAHALAAIGPQAEPALDAMVKVFSGADGKDAESLAADMAAIGPRGIRRLEQATHAGRRLSAEQIRYVIHPERDIEGDLATDLATDGPRGLAAVARLARLGHLCHPDRVARWFVALLAARPDAPISPLALPGMEVFWWELPRGAASRPPALSDEARRRCIDVLFERFTNQSDGSPFSFASIHLATVIAELGRTGAGEFAVPAIRRVPRIEQIDTPFMHSGSSPPTTILNELLCACPISWPARIDHVRR